MMKRQWNTVAQTSAAKQKNGNGGLNTAKTRATGHTKIKKACRAD